MTDITSSRPVMLTYALAYAGKGWRVFPLHSVHSGDCSCGRDTCGSVGKHPRTKNGVKDATTDLEQITRWWTTWPLANIGIATGLDPATGQGLYVIDIDTAKGADPSDFADLMERTISVCTGSGDFHIYLQCEEPLPNTAGKLGPFIDTRGEGGYVVAPPSRNRAGKYAWQPEQREILTIPPHLLTLLKHLHDLPFGVQNVQLHYTKEEQHEVSSHPQTAETHHAALAANQAPAAASAAPAQEDVSSEPRNTVLTRQAGLLHALGNSFGETRAMVLAYNQERYGHGRHPEGPLTEDELERTTFKTMKKWDATRGPVRNTGPEITSLPDLMNRDDLPQARWIVPGLLPEGLALLAGSPKMGKSFLAYDLGLTCAIGTANGGGLVLGRYEVEPLGVLYLALEDHHRRMQDRASLLLGERSVPVTFEYALRWPALPLGGLLELDARLTTTPETRLVIIDTLVRVRGTPKRGLDAYQADSELLADLQALALRHHATVLVVTHTHKPKQQSEEPFDKVNGSTGQTGTADTTIILERARTEHDGTLHVTGRDIEEQKLAVHFNADTCRWTITGVADDAPARPRPVNPLNQSILDLLGEKGTMTPAEMVKELGKSEGTIRGTLARMIEDKVVMKEGYGRYMLPPSNLNLFESTKGTPAAD